MYNNTVVYNVWFLIEYIKTFLFSTDEVMSMDQSLLRIILENHILKSKIGLGQLYNGQRLETIGGRFLRVFIYRTVRPLLWSWAQKLWLGATKHTLYALPLSFDHQSSYLWDITLILLPLTFGLFLQAVCIENACLVRGSKEGSNGALHLMRTLLKPAEKTMFEILTENGGFKWVQWTWTVVLKCSIILKPHLSVSFH